MMDLLRQAVRSSEQVSAQFSGLDTRLRKLETEGAGMTDRPKPNFPERKGGALTTARALAGAPPARLRGGLLGGGGAVRRPDRAAPLGEEDDDA